MIPDPIRYIVMLDFQGLYTIYLYYICSQLLSPNIFCCTQLDQELYSFYFYFLHKRFLCTSAAICLRGFLIQSALEMQPNWACDVNLTHVDMLNGNQDFAVLQSIFKSRPIIEGYAFMNFHIYINANLIRALMSQCFITLMFNSCYFILINVNIGQAKL